MGGGGVGDDGIMAVDLVEDGVGVSRGGSEDAVTTDLFSRHLRRRNEVDRGEAKRIVPAMGSIDRKSEMRDTWYQTREERGWSLESIQERTPEIIHPAGFWPEKYAMHSLHPRVTSHIQYTHNDYLNRILEPP